MFEKDTLELTDRQLWSLSMALSSILGTVEEREANTEKGGRGRGKEKERE